MRVICRRRLREFSATYPGTESALTTWWRVADKAKWTNIGDVRKTYPHADAVKLKCGVVATVFNVGGNNYRLVVRIEYQSQYVYVKQMMPHAEYDKEKWKDQLCQELPK